MSKKSRLAGMLDIAQGNNQDTIVKINLEYIQSFKNHPFHVKEDERMKQLIKSIEENGVMDAIHVRKKGLDMYEIISGHRRVEAARRNGITIIPSIIKDVDDETATILMIDSNLTQRENIMLSEKAFAYKMKLEAINIKIGRPNSGHSVLNLQARDIVGEEAGESGRQIQRYIRLTELIPTLLDKVDNNELGFIPAVDISYLSKEEQGYVQEVMELAKVKPTKVQADLLKKKSQESRLTREDIKAILVEEKKVKLNGMSATKLKSYFPKEMAKELDDERMDEIMQEMVSDWLNKQK